jgi:hypothetical protein
MREVWDIVTEEPARYGLAIFALFAITIRGRNKHALPAGPSSADAARAASTLKKYISANGENLKWHWRGLGPGEPVQAAATVTIDDLVYGLDFLEKACWRQDAFLRATTSGFFPEIQPTQKTREKGVATRNIVLTLMEQVKSGRTLDCIPPRRRAHVVALVTNALLDFREHHALTADKVREIYRTAHRPPRPTNRQRAKAGVFGKISPKRPRTDGHTGT